jgi:hypothetical protein
MIHGDQKRVPDTVTSALTYADALKCARYLIERFQTITTPHIQDPKKLTVIKESLRKNISSYFTYMAHEGVLLDNNKAERALRHLVLKRKISFGSRTQKGADTLSVLCSALLSLWWRKPRNFFQEYLALRGV